MTDFGKWVRGWNDVAAMKGSGQHDIVVLTAQLYDAASPFAATQDKATDPRVGLTQPVTVAEAEALNDALAACREFQEKYA